MTQNNQSFSFTQGGQTQIHKLRMLKQVIGTTFFLSFLAAFITFVGYYLYRNHWSHILMIPFWGLAEFMESLRGVFKSLNGFTYFIDFSTHEIKQCSSSYFLNAGYIQRFFNYMNQHFILGAIYSVIAFCVTFVVSIFYFTRQGKKLKETKQTSGLEMMDLKGYQSACKKKKVKTRLIVDQIPIPYDAEVKHMMISGTTGSGKSNMMNHLLKAIRDRGDKAVIVDTTGGFVEKFYDPKKDVILNPFDARSTDWCLWSEPLRQVYEFEDMAESLIPPTLHGDPFWVNASRQMVSEVLKHAKVHNKTLSEALEILMTKDLHLSKSFFNGTSVAALFSKEMEKTALSIRTTLATYLRCLFILKDNTYGFSIDQWVKDDSQRGFLFIHGVPKQRSQLRPLWSVWFNIAIKSIMDLNTDPNRRVWFIVDELASLNKLPCLDMALAEGRKYGACIVLGFQNLAQIQSLYGRDGSKSMSELMVSKFMFQAVDHENARMLSYMFGNREYVEAHENVSYGANEIRDGVNLSHQKRTEPLVSSEKLMQLNPLHFYALIAGQKICLRESFSYYSSLSASIPLAERDLGFTIGDVLLQKGSEFLTVNDDDIVNEKENIVPFDKNEKNIKSKNLENDIIEQ